MGTYRRQLKILTLFWNVIPVKFSFDTLEYSFFHNGIRCPLGFGTRMSLKLNGFFVVSFAVIVHDVSAYVGDVSMGITVFPIG